MDPNVAVAVNLSLVGGLSTSLDLQICSRTTPAFGTTTTPAFGTTTTPAFSATTTLAFGSTSTYLFGASSTPTFGSTAFDSSTTPGFGSSGAIGSTPFGTSPSPFEAQTSPFSSQTAAPIFGQAPFGNQSGGTRIQPYTQTADVDSATTGTQPFAKLDSISAMPSYKEKSHEELRWEDYQRGDKGGPNPSGTPAATTSFPSAQQNIFQAHPSTPPNPFVAKPSIFASTGVAYTSASIFNSPSTASSSPFPSSTTNTIFEQRSGSAFPAGFPSSTPAFTVGSLFSTPTPGMTGELFGRTSSPFPTTTFQQSAPTQTPSMFSFQAHTQTASTGGFPDVSNTMNQAPFGQPTSVASSNKVPTGPGIKDILKLVVKCGAKEGSDLHFTATKLFMKAHYRELFSALESNEGRFDWLKRMHEENEEVD